MREAACLAVFYAPIVQASERACCLCTDSRPFRFALCPCGVASLLTRATPKSALPCACGGRCVGFFSCISSFRFALRLRGEVGEYRRFCGWLGGNVVFRGVCGGIPVDSQSSTSSGFASLTHLPLRRERRGNVYLLCPLSGIPFGAKNAPFVRTCMVACRYGQMGRRFGFPRGFICFVQQNGVCHDLPPGFSSSRSSFLPRQKAYAISISIAAAKNSREEARLARTESISSRR